MKTICLALALAFATLDARPSVLDVIDRLMAVVSGDPLTLSDVNAAVAFDLVTPPAGAADRTAAALDLLIERRLMLMDVERYQPPEPAPESIDERLAAIRQRLGSGYEPTLKATGMSDGQLRREIRDGLRIQIYLNQRFGGVDPAARPQLISDWLAGLRRRTQIAVLYLPK